MATAELWSWLPPVLSAPAKLVQPGAGTARSCPGLWRALHVRPFPLLTVIALFVFLLITNKGLEVLSLCATLELLV